MIRREVEDVQPNRFPLRVNGGFWLGYASVEESAVSERSRIRIDLVARSQLSLHGSTSV